MNTITFTDLYYDHPKYSRYYEADHPEFEDAIITKDKRKMRRELRKMGVVGELNRGVR